MTKCKYCSILVKHIQLRDSLIDSLLQKQNKLIAQWNNWQQMVLGENSRTYPTSLSSIAPGWKGGKLPPLGGSLGEYSLNDFDEQPADKHREAEQKLNLTAACSNLSNNLTWDV